jgi:uncharacterized radical SAM superfamily Fe-S cluster-containing enzyme
MTLLKETKSICPDCFLKENKVNIIDASIVEKDGKILYQKTCKKHGDFEDIYFGDAELYKKFERFALDGKKLENPVTKRDKGCPLDCGLCDGHYTTTVLANIDLTNRCNFHCPVCFANSMDSGYVFEPTLEEIRHMMKTLREERPASTPAVQFAGGEPLIRNDILEIIKMAKEFNFSQIQAATNGLRISESLEFTMKLKEAGMNGVYLQFDGVTPEVYMKTRGFNAWPIKLKAIENCRKADLAVVLVPTLIKGVNDDQVGDMIDFSAKNVDVVRGLNVQPVSFTGRIDRSKLKKQRITIPDFIKLVEEQTKGVITKEDFYPVPWAVPISRLIALFKGIPQTEFTCHPHCGAATYVFVEDGKITPITRFFDAEGFYDFTIQVAEEYKNKKFKKAKIGLKLLNNIGKFIDDKKKPEWLDLKKLIFNIVFRGTRGTLEDFHSKKVNSLLIGCMHFQDPYNLDLERVCRCCIHYAIPDGRLIPFCTYNTIHRANVEKEFSIPLDEWNKKQKKLKVIK